VYSSSMDTSEIETLLDRLDRDSLGVGVKLPEQLTVKGETVPVKALVFDVCSDGELPDHFDFTMLELKQILRRDRNDCIEKIEKGKVSLLRGEEIVEKVSHIDRVLNTLESADKDRSIEQQMDVSEAQDIKRWRKFVRKVQE